jgi:type I restriction enzyme M protein
LGEAKNDKGKVTKALINDRIKVLKKDCVDPDELAVLEECLKLVNSESSAKTAHKKYKLELDAKVFKKYPEFIEAETKTLVVEEKWLSTLETNVVAEIERVTQQLANRVKTLEERYAEPLPVLTKSVEELSANVDGHLKKMGLQW